MLIWFVVIYWVISVGIGLWAAMRVKNTADFAAAGHSLPLPIVTAMVFATWFGSEAVLGIPAEFIKEGLGGVVADPFGTALCLILVGLFFAKHLYNRRMLTIGDFFREKYGRTVEVLVTLCIVASYLGWVAAQIKALGLVFNVVSDGAISQDLGMIIGACSVLVYTLFGGMWSVAITDFVQMIVIIIGLLLVTHYAADQAGGVSHVIAKASAEGKFEFLPKLQWLDMIAWIATLCTMALGSIPQQDVFQRVNSAKTENIAIWATTIGGVTYFFFAAVPLFLAYTANIIDPEMVSRLLYTDAQLILPTLIMEHMPFYMQVIFFGALISVIMSTASGTLLAPSITFTENILKGFVPHMSDRTLLIATQVTVLVFSGLVTLYAIGTEASIHSMVENAYRITLAGAFVPLAAGLFWKRASNLGAALAILFGLSTWIILEVTGIDEPVQPQVFGAVASLCGMLIGSYLSPNRHLLGHSH